MGCGQRTAGLPTTKMMLWLVAPLRFLFRLYMVWIMFLVDCNGSSFATVDITGHILYVVPKLVLHSGLSWSLDCHYGFTWQFRHLESSCWEFKLLVSGTGALSECSEPWERQFRGSCARKCDLLWFTSISSKVRIRCNDTITFHLLSAHSFSLMYEHVIWKNLKPLHYPSFMIYLSLRVLEY